MNALKIGIGVALLASPAYADRKMADQCAADLPPNSKAIYAAAVGKMRRGADNESVVTAITLRMVGSGKLNPLTARTVAEAAGDCLRKLAD
ncbi:MAG: hypothetical protein AB7F41_14380 [Methylocystis sp.]|uniref:hypothetical protein n=1 Tax=Methylocystis sp. TaxID=1911079 RepID=UPI003D112035